MKLELYYPLKSVVITQRFGNPALMYTNLGLQGHNGIDFYAPDGYPIYAAHDGTVVFAGEDGAAGYGVVIRTDDVFEYDIQPRYFKTIYWHAKKEGIKVIPGQKVKTGDLIMLADNTGMSTGSHLHFGLKPQMQGEEDWQWWNVEQDNGYKGAIDPAPYLNKYSAVDYSKVVSLKKTKELVENLIKDYPILSQPLSPLLSTLDSFLKKLITL